MNQHKKLNPANMVRHDKKPHKHNHKNSETKAKELKARDAKSKDARSKDARPKVKVMI